MVFIWFDAEGRDPTYELEARPEMETEWIDYTCLQTEFAMHISEMAENSADYYHFNVRMRMSPYVFEFYCYMYAVLVRM